MEEKSCVFDEYYRLRNAINFADKTELSIQLKYLNDNYYKGPNPRNQAVNHLLEYRKQIANRYMNAQINDDEKNTLLDLFKKINKEIINTLGLNY